MAALESKGLHAHPGMQRYYRRAIPQMSRCVRREITKDQLMVNLRLIAEQEAVSDLVTFEEFKVGGYLLPWERAESGAAVQLASQGGA